MTVLNKVASISALLLLCACGRLVEFGDEDVDGGRAGSGGSSGSGGRGANGGSGGGGDSGAEPDSGGDDDGGAVVPSDGGPDGSESDDVAPILLSTVPDDDATNVPLDADVIATFSEPMDPSTITGATFIVMQGSTPIAGSVMLDAETATFIPNDSLANDTIYTASISAGATDRAGNALAGGDAVWMFRTGDTIRPTVIDIDPMRGATQVESGATVAAMFSESMEDATLTDVTFTLTRGATPVAGEVTLVGDTATFDPNLPLPNGLYVATISSMAADLAGNTLENAETWTFRVGDTTRPVVIATRPRSGQQEVSITPTVTATFSENMDDATVDETTFTLRQGAALIDGAVMLVDAAATFIPTAPLDYDTEYTVTISTGATDLAGNRLVSDAVWTFTTGDSMSPSVVVTNPADGDMQVALNKIIAATFDEGLDDSTVTSDSVTVTGPGALPVAGMVFYDEVESIVTFVPMTNLLPSSTYTVTISTDVTDLTGNPLLIEEIWSFMTGTNIAQVIPQLPLVLGASSNFVVLAAAGISNIALSSLNGDVGLSPAGGASITGLASPADCPEVNGTVYVVDASGPACAVIDPDLLDDARRDAALAYLNATAAVRGPPQLISGDLNGLTLYPGLYQSGTSIEISPGGLLYLDAQGDPNAVFILRSATTITTSSTSEVVLTKGARANNVYWTAGSAVTLGTNSIMKGTVIAGTALSLLTGANLEGRALNQGPAATAVTLDTSTITLPSP